MNSSIKHAALILVVTLVVGAAIGGGLVKSSMSRKEGFAGQQGQCGCGGRRVAEPCPACVQPDMSKYVLKATIPPCAPMPDLSQYMLKTECPPVPDLSKYVLKSSVPKPQPIIIDSSSCSKEACGECPPCPRPRCPDVKCAPPTKCPTPAPCPRPVCPTTTVKCRTEQDASSTVRPYLAPLGLTGFGM